MAGLKTENGHSPAAFEWFLADPRRLADFGITRVGELTGLDRVGIPVWFASRPNSRSLSVAQGKGLTHEQARISAIMEACEHACAERFETFDGVWCSEVELPSKGLQPATLGRLPGCDSAVFDRRRDRLWVRGTSLCTGEEIVAPYEAVGLDMRVDAPWDNVAFRMSTVGLGAGSTFEHACRHALREAIENDATLLLDTLGPFVCPSRELRHERGLSAQLDEAIALLDSADIAVRFAEVRSPTRLPVIGAFIRTREDFGVGIDAREFAGYACRPQATDAALAALLEAVQSRLTDISGARDDIDPRDFAHDILARCRHRRADCDGMSAAESCPDISMQGEIAACRAAGADDVLAFALAPPGLGFEVVRVLVPGFGHAPSEGNVDLGPRGIAALLAQFGR